VKKKAINKIEIDFMAGVYISIAGYKKMRVEVVLLSQNYQTEKNKIIMKNGLLIFIGLLI